MKNASLKHINLPIVDLSKQTELHVFVAHGNQIEWNGHPSTVLPDGKTMFCVLLGRRDGLLQSKEAFGKVGFIFRGV
ncbi:MAG: hypothetical protein HQL31_11175 [Planctomycetes bacterium]|nr:hypothetical protein [Planctomycetota bacterium]